MKQLLIFISLLLSILNAETLPNTGLQQNQYGYYYGEGVTFGGLAIIGEWDFQAYSYSILDFDENGTVGAREWGDAVYGVSEDGKELRIIYNDLAHSTTPTPATLEKEHLRSLSNKENSFFLIVELTNTFLSHSKPYLKRLLI